MSASQHPTKKQPKVNNAIRAGTMFPVGRVERLLREEALAPRLRTEAAVALTAILDEVMGSILDESIKVTLDNKRSRINPRFLKMAREKEDEFQRLMPGTFPCSGVVPHKTQEVTVQ